MSASKAAPDAHTPQAGRAAPRTLLVAFAALGLAFALWPEIDLEVSDLFARGQAGFPLQQDALLAWINRAVLRLSLVVQWGLGLLALLSLWRAARNPLARWRQPLVFLALAAALGPGLLVNVVFKEHSGRARPVHVERYGGTQHFTPAFAPANECRSNCAFVSGHVAGATLPTAGYFLAGTRRRRRAWLLGGFALAGAVGLMRLAVGAHFLSDVVLAAGLTWLVIVLCARLWPPRVAAGGRSAALAGAQ